MGTVWKREEEKEERIKVRKKMIHKRLLSHLIIFLSYTEMENDINKDRKIHNEYGKNMYSIPL